MITELFLREKLPQMLMLTRSTTFTLANTNAYHNYIAQVAANTRVRNTLFFSPFVNYHMHEAFGDKKTRMGKCINRVAKYMNRHEYTYKGANYVNRMYK